MKDFLLPKLFFLCTLVFFAPQAYSAGADENNNASENQSGVEARTVNLTFPATGDTRFTQSGPNFWNQGDFVEGQRNFSSSVDTLEMTLITDPNTLTCDTQDHAVMIDGATIGTFFVNPGDPFISQNFSFPTVAAGVHTIRIETTRTVDPGCGSAGFPNDVSNFHFLSGTVGGSATGMFSPVIVICNNLTTGQSVVQVSGPSWDCEALGLVVNQFDWVVSAALGRAN